MSRVYPRACGETLDNAVVGTLGIISSLHQPPAPMVRSDFLEKIELINVWKRRGQRAPAFRREVLRAYERRCAVCDFDVRLGEDLIDVEA